MADNQFDLLRTQRFLPLFTTQVLSAFVDNLFKSATLIMLVFNHAPGSSKGDLLANIASGLFILPFFLFSALAGQFADRFD